MDVDTPDDGTAVTTRGGKILKNDIGTIPLLFKRMLSKGTKSMDVNTMVLETRMNGRRVVKDAMEMMMQKRTQKISKTIFKKKKGAKSSTQKGLQMGVKNNKTVSSQPGMTRFLLGGRGLFGIGTEDNGIGKVEFPWEFQNLDKKLQSD